jgi:hypothetical protein
MGYPQGLEVRVCHRGANYAWEIWHPGNAAVWKFSVPIYESDAAARDAGSRALAAILVRSGKKTKNQPEK